MIIVCSGLLPAGQVPCNTRLVPFSLSPQPISYSGGSSDCVDVTDATYTVCTCYCVYRLKVLLSSRSPAQDGGGLLEDGVAGEGSHHCDDHQPGGGH